jgi:hypothetical protein
MPRNVPDALLVRMRRPVTTLCRILKIAPLHSEPFGITSLNRDIAFDDGGGSITYRAACGYTPSDVVTKTDLSVNNAEAASLVAQYPLTGVTMDAINRGVYDGAPYVEMLIDYEDTAAGFAIVSSGNIGQITTTDKLACQIELRSLIQILKQTNMVELTSISCRAKFGDARCKKPIIWYRGIVTAVGSETDRTFSFRPPDFSPESSSDAEFWSSSSYTNPEQQYLTSDNQYAFPAPHTFSDGSSYGFFEPGIVHWLSGDYTSLESEVETFDYTTNTITLAIPVPTTVQVGDEFRISQNCAKSKAMCIERWANIINMRAEPELPLGNGTDLQSPTPSA